jgi:Tfp pilus assembly protein FimT
MELLLILIIVAVTAAIAAPSLAGFSRGRRLPNTATALVTTARWCRVKALGDGVTYRLTIDRANNQWSVTKDDESGNFVEVTEEMGKATPLPEGITFGDMKFQGTMESEEEGDYVTFKQNGRTDVVTIELRSDYDQVVVVGCDMPLGTFHIVKTAVAE